MRHTILIYPEQPPEIIAYVTVFESRHFQVQTRDELVSFEDWLRSESLRVAREFPCAIIRRPRDRQIALAIIKLPKA